MDDDLTRVELKLHNDTTVKAFIVGLGTSHVTIVADEPIDSGAFYSLKVLD